MKALFVSLSQSAMFCYCVFFLFVVAEISMLLLAHDQYSVYLLTSGLPRHLQHFVGSWKLIYFGNLTQTLSYIWSLLLAHLPAPLWNHKSYLDLFAWCVRLSRLLVGFRTHFKSLHFHSFFIHLSFSASRTWFSPCSSFSFTLSTHSTFTTLCALYYRVGLWSLLRGDRGTGRALLHRRRHHYCAARTRL